MLTLLLVALFAAPRDARADDSHPTEPPAPRWALGFNPLALVIGRYGADLEHPLWPHLVLLLNGHVDYASHDWPAMEYDRRSPVWGFGGEAGWRWFTGERSMQGFFLGASLVCGWYSFEYYGRRHGLPGAGLAADMGGQVDLGGPWFLTSGVGLQYLWTHSYPADIAPGVSWIMGAGVNPRLLVTVGALIW
jgi:hypothetical protein